MTQFESMVEFDPLRQLDVVLAKIEQVRKSGSDPVTLRELEVLELVAIRRLAPSGTTYREQAEEIVSSTRVLPANSNERGPRITAPLRGVLLALRHDYAAGFMKEVEELVRANTFDDFLEMATYLLEEGYKDPAAVLAGGVLEGHLRKLGAKSAVKVADDRGPRKASAINDDLYKAKVYGSLDHKNVTGWLQIRNDAAHADWSKFNSDQVGLMIAAVREFVARMPA